MKSQESADRLLTIGRPPNLASSTAGVLYELPGWAHYIWLIYLGFLFTPALGPNRDRIWLWPTLISIPVFVYLYSRILRSFRHKVIPGPDALPEVLTIALLGYVMAYFNDSANTYLIYCIAVVPFTTLKLRRLVGLVAVLLGVYGLELLVIGFKPVMYGITCVVGIAAAASNFMLVTNRRKNAILRLSREEVHRLGRVAERERIGRDLHDLLGHTLSLIAIKSELAVKLMDRDRAAAAREVAEVTHIARDALKQVRTAVTGIRAAALENEVASAKTLLDTAGVTLTFEREGGMLPHEIETTLAMIVREAATNIQRHSAAQNATIAVTTETATAETGGKSTEKTVLLRVSDDGRGGVTANGNGLSGIRERVRSLAGSLEIESPRGKGTTLSVRLPLTGSAADARTSAAVGATRATASDLSPSVADTADRRPMSAVVERPPAEGVAGHTSGEQPVELRAMSGAVRT
jgi:two-component system, NarL family, sensor histidine kinase DesK